MESKTWRELHRPDFDEHCDKCAWKNGRRENYQAVERKVWRLSEKSELACSRFADGCLCSGRQVGGRGNVQKVHRTVQASEKPGRAIEIFDRPRQFQRTENSERIPEFRDDKGRSLTGFACTYSNHRRQPLRKAARPAMDKAELGQADKDVCRRQRLAPEKNNREPRRDY